MNASPHIIDVGSDFTRFPAGRTISDGPYSGEVFREKLLRPYLDDGQAIIVRLDSALGYGSSFLEEAFGGLVRLGYKKDLILEMIKFDTADPLLREEIEGYIKGVRI